MMGPPKFATEAFFVPKDGQTHAWSLTSWASKKSPGQLGAPIQGGAFQVRQLGGR